MPPHLGWGLNPGEVLFVGAPLAIFYCTLSQHQGHGVTIGDNVSLLMASLGVRFPYLAAVKLQSNGLERRG